VAFPTYLRDGALLVDHDELALRVQPLVALCDLEPGVKQPGFQLRPTPYRDEQEVTRHDHVEGALQRRVRGELVAPAEVQALWGLVPWLALHVLGAQLDVLLQERHAAGDLGGGGVGAERGAAQRDQTVARGHVEHAAGTWPGVGRCGGMASVR
jgi:hypothetical protein